MKKAYIEITDACNHIVEWINSGNYVKFVEASNGDTKDDGFRAACFILPGFLLSECAVKYVDE